MVTLAGTTTKSRGILNSGVSSIADVNSKGRNKNIDKNSPKFETHAIVKKAPTALPSNTGTSNITVLHAATSVTASSVAHNKINNASLDISSMRLHLLSVLLVSMTLLICI